MKELVSFPERGRLTRSPRSDKRYARRTASCPPNDNSSPAFVFRGNPTEAHMGRGLLLWLIGIPLPIIILIWLFGGLH
jgi:hypothetical protein